MQKSEAGIATAAVAGDVAAQSHSILTLWHLLSLDAPCVAALWTVFVARIFHIPMPWTAPLALAVAVWMLYVADRIADASAGKAFEERHRFHQQHRVAFAVCWLLCAPVLLLLVLHLPHALRDGWLLLSIPLAAYVGAVHALRVSYVPKEPLIAVFFGMAVAMPVISSGLVPRSLAPSVALFTLLCWLNCAAIAAWESPASGYLDPITHLLGRNFASFTVVSILLSLWAALQQGPSRSMGVAVSTSLVLLLVLEQRRGRMNHTHVRALADAALLAPLIMLLLPAWISR